MHSAITPTEPASHRPIGAQPTANIGFRLSASESIHPQSSETAAVQTQNLPPSGPTAGLRRCPIREAPRQRTVITNAFLAQLIESHRSAFGRGHLVPGIPGLNPNRNHRALTMYNVKTGEIFSAGDKVMFTQQSISKSTALALAVKLTGEHELQITRQLLGEDVAAKLDPFELGFKVLRKRIAFEGAGQNYDSNATVPHKPGMPYNPHNNNGALLVWDIIVSHTPEGTDPFQNYLEYIRNLSGDQSLECNELTADAEFKASQKNRELLKTLDLKNDPETVLKHYCKACHIEVNTENLAMIGATHTHGLELDGEVLLSESAAEKLTRSNAVSGRYNKSGGEYVKSGFMSKTGVGGGEYGVFEDQKDWIIAGYDPNLDNIGNPTDMAGWTSDLSKRGEFVSEQQLEAEKREAPSSRTGLQNMASSGLDEGSARPQKTGRWERIIKRVRTWTEKGSGATNRRGATRPRTEPASVAPRPTSGTSSPQFRVSADVLDKQLRASMTDESMRELVAKIKEHGSPKLGFFLKPAKDSVFLRHSTYLLTAVDKAGISKDYHLLPDLNELEKIIVLPTPKKS